MNEENVITFTLNGYEWHELMAELEFAMNFANRDVSRAKRLYQRLAAQTGVNVVFDDPPAAEEKKPERAERPKRRGWLR